MRGKGTSVVGAPASAAENRSLAPLASPRFADVRSPPADLTAECLRQVLAAGWRLRPASLDYVPEGAGSYHWKLTGEDGQPHFVTVDDLDRKDWLGDTREAVFAGLGQALATADTLRHEAGLEFVVAPVAGGDGEFLRRLDSRYTVSVFPFLAGRSYPFGSFPDARLRDQALDMVATLHQTTRVLGGRAPRHVPDFGGREDLAAFLNAPDRPWNDGPFGETARSLLATRTPDLARLAAGFDRLVETTIPARANPVITHGEPHPGNLMSVNGRLVLIDWDTAALAPPERDVAVIAAPGREDLDVYQERTGRALDPAVLILYRARWYLDDIASAIRLFRRRHHDSADTRLWRDGLAPRLEQLPAWLDRLA
jgi:spectinomycin phosphotransferase